MATSVSPSTRLHPGTSLAHAFTRPSAVPSLASLDSAFELQEYLALLLRYDTHSITRLTKLPTGVDGEEVEKWAWVYEQMRRLVEDMNDPLITQLQLECTRLTCPEMKANEWQYVCTAHGAGQSTMGQCCAIDYTLHTIDHTTALLNSPKNFPSRLSVPQTSQRHFPAIARRLARVFMHAYFHHREVFEESEAEHSVYARFKALVRTYDLLDPEFLMIPAIHPEDEEDDTSCIEELRRTETMVRFSALNLSDTPPSSGPAKGSSTQEQSALARSIASPSHEAANAVEEAAFTPSPAVLAASPGLREIPLPDVPAPDSPEEHPNALVIYPPVGEMSPPALGASGSLPPTSVPGRRRRAMEADDAQEMDLVDMEVEDGDLQHVAPLHPSGDTTVIEAPDEARGADVVEAESASLPERVKIHMSGETHAVDKDTEVQEIEYADEGEMLGQEETGDAEVRELLREAQEQSIGQTSNEAGR